jgi:NADH dehydrogenase
VRTILVVGGGYAGFYTAWKLEKKLRRDEAKVVVVDPRPYMTYQPFLPEVLAGSVEARHAAVSQRRHLRKTTIISGSVVHVDHAHKTATIQPAEGPEFALAYDIIAVTAGAVTRQLGVPGIAETAIGMKHVEEAVAIRDRLLTNFDRASTLGPGPQRQKLLTVTFVGGGFSGVEGFGEALSLASALCRIYPELDAGDPQFHLVEARGRILPEVTDKPGEWVVRSLEKRGAHVHLNAQLVSAQDGHVVLSDGTEFDSETIVWTAGVKANPVLVNSDLPLDERSRIKASAELRVEGLPEVWTAGDNAAVPDLARIDEDPNALCPPNAQHAVRQANLMAKNIIAVLRDRKPKAYKHKNVGSVASLGLHKGVADVFNIKLKGFLAWAAHRGYHVARVPTFNRKARVVADWLLGGLFRREVISMGQISNPRAEFARVSDS